MKEVVPEMSGPNPAFDLDPLVSAVLYSVHTVAAGSSGRELRVRGVLDQMLQQFAYGPRYMYQVVLDLARRDLVHLPLLDISGEPGGLFGPAPPPDVTYCRMSTFGELARHSLNASGPPTPIGLINGNMYQGGLRPPLDSVEVLNVLTAVATTRDAGDVHDYLSGPSFPSQCSVEFAHDELFSGVRTELTLRPIIQPNSFGGAGRFEVVNLPPSLSVPEVIATLKTMRPAIQGVADETIGREPRVCFAIRSGRDADKILDRVRSSQRLSVRTVAQFPMPMMESLRQWVEQYPAEAILEGLSRVGRARGAQPSGTSDSGVARAPLWADA
jgi:hypothetical protein